jgi:hypothetical protein
MDLPDSNKKPVGPVVKDLPQLAEQQPSVEADFMV